MLITKKEPNGSGAFPPLLSWDETVPPNGYALWPEEVDTKDFYSYNGFVTLTFKEVKVVSQERAISVPAVESCTPNVQAWEEWKAGLLESKVPEPTEAERIAALEEQLAETDEAAIQLYEAQLAQETVNAEQDEAIIEIYETKEGLLNG